MTDIFSLLLIFIPLLLILWLANLADKRRAQEDSQQVFAILTYLLLAMLWGVLFFVGVIMMLVGVAMDAAPEVFAAGAPAGYLPDSRQLMQMGGGMWVPAVLGMILLLPPVRRLFARFLNIDATRTVHAVALSYTMLIVANLWITVAFGIDNLANVVEAGPEIEASDLVNMTWVQELLFALMAVVGVGWLVRRSWKQDMQRLKVVVPTWRQALTGIGLGLFAVVALILLEYGIGFIGVGFDENVERLSEEIVGPLMTTIPGILTLGLAAALGEEFLFRGALQPRFGIWVTAFLFALLHSNYGITLSSLIVFLLGLLLGWARLRYNTSTSMILHATYNISLGLMAYLSLWPAW